MYPRTPQPSGLLSHTMSVSLLSTQVAVPLLSDVETFPSAALAPPALTTTPTAAAANTTPARRIQEFFNLTSLTSLPVHLRPHRPPPRFQSASNPLPQEVDLGRR